ncbi:MAG: hypothetical protein U0793_18025 [Gemmataceae bacterium]
MISDDLEELVFDALYFRRLHPDRTCLQTNLAAQELQGQSVAALPHIERVLTKVVSPASLEPPKRRSLPGSGDMSYEVDEFPGLSGLLGAYLVIGSKHDVLRVVDFLRGVPPTLQAKAVALLPVFFRKMKVRAEEKDVNSLKDPPAKPLLLFVEELSRSENQLLRENALRAMSFFPQG